MFHLSKRRLWKAGVALCFAATACAGTFGKVVSIGGHASDLALDEGRGVLYIANFTANRIEVMSLADHSIQTSMNVAAQPGSLALSPDGKYLVVTHYGNYKAPDSPNNAMTVIDLSAGTKQTFGMSTPPLAVAFGLDGRALVVTTAEFLLFDPATGRTTVLDTIAGLVAKTLPQPAGSVPTQIVATSMGVSGDGYQIYGLTDTLMYHYDVRRGALRAGSYTSTPTMGPRAITVSQDGSLWASGWILKDSDMWTVSEFPNITGDLNIGSLLIDSQRNLIYAQMGEQNQPLPVLQIVDADNLTVRERLNLQENLSGKSALSSDGNIMYALSESGVTILPVGSLPQQPRIVLSKETLVFRGNYCDRQVATQEFNITSESGTNADFRITSDNPGVRVNQSFGVTPATIRVTVEPSAFQNSKGTSTVNLKIETSRGMNQPKTVKVYVNSRESDQKGTLMTVAGKLVDVLADPSRDRFFVLRQDRNEVLVFDGSTYAQTATLRTYNAPKSMTMTFDRRYLLVGNDKSHLINVYDLETLQSDRPIRIGDYVQSIAASARTILAATRSSSGGDNKIYRVDIGSRTSTAPPSLGAFENKIAVNTVMVPTPNGSSILIAQSDGTLMLYNGNADSFTVSRKETTPLTGAYAASSFDQFVVGNALLNSSLVPVRRFETDSGKPSGFAFVDQIGYRINAPNASAPGIIQKMDLTTGEALSPATRIVEAPILGATGEVFTRTLAPLASRSAIIVLTTSGFSVLPWNFDAAIAPPRIERVVNAADLTQPVAPGGLITVLGNALSPVSQSSSQIPLPTALGESCLTVNGLPVPVMFVSPRQVNAQLPFAVEGNTAVVLRTPGGVSDNYNLTILPGAPSVFRSGVAGPQSDVPTVVRSTNNQVVTLSNPIHHGDTIVIYATGLGRTSPSVDAGVPAPAEPLATAIVPPTVTLGGVPLEVQFAGLTPGEIGIYQINALVRGNVPQGMQVPLTITQGNGVTSLPVRVLN
jgi:uncharacterized protein (TIGR03437 family)